MVKVGFKIGLVFLISLIFLSNNKTFLFVPTKLKKHTTYFFPQGWSFFTRSPREDLVDIFEYDPKKNSYNLINLADRSKCYFGLDRINRIVAYEISMILEEVTKVKKSKTIFEDNFYSDCEITVISNNIKHLKPGKYLLIIKKIKPWAYINLKTNDESKYLSIRI